MPEFRCRYSRHRLLCRSATCLERQARRRLWCRSLRGPSAAATEEKDLPQGRGGTVLSVPPSRHVLRENVPPLPPFTRCQSLRRGDAKARKCTTQARSGSPEHGEFQELSKLPHPRINGNYFGGEPRGSAEIHTEVGEQRVFLCTFGGAANRIRCRPPCGGWEEAGRREVPLLLCLTPIVIYCEVSARISTGRVGRK